jgi:phenylpropionate dioxygenase-like ring-hydroxylating dioxygenase large terminal subunit
MNPSDARSLIPELGLREYWYPAVLERRVSRRKPVGVKLLGEDLVFFRGRDGRVAALDSVCPHRGGSLAHGDCHYPGTVACPYHAWVFDEDGECVAVLSEGPESRIPGKVRARAYPTRTLKGVVFVWMGQGDPAPLEEDVPPEFFEGRQTLVFSRIRDWAVNWRVAIENSLDSHVMYVHRDAFLQLLEPLQQFGPLGYRPRVVKDRAVIAYIPDQPGRPYQEFYPRVNGLWPKHRWRLRWVWAFRWLRARSARMPCFHADEEWGMHTMIEGQRVRSAGHHLPSMFRFDFAPWMYTRWCVPVDATTTRVFYFHAVRRRGGPGRLWSSLVYHGFVDWARNTNFSSQDYRVMAPQRYDTPEKLSGSDAEVIVWRKLLLRARGMPVHSAALDVDDGPWSGTARP